MLHEYLEMMYGILVQSANQRRIRVHASGGEQVDVKRHAIQILDGHYYTFHMNICGNGLVHITNGILLESLQCLLVEG